jgi:hypothetical protein
MKPHGLILKRSSKGRSCSVMVRICKVKILATKIGLTYLTIGMICASGE